MRLARFKSGEEVFSGIIEGEIITQLKSGDVLGRAGGFDTLDLRKGERVFNLDAVTLLAPTLPSKIIAIGLNYKAHAEEFNKELPKEPMIFLKPPTAVIGPGEDIIYPSHMSRRIDYEGELGVVIGKKAKDIAPEVAKEHILGYTCFNDVTARDLQKTDTQYTRAKGFDTFAPIGPWIETDLRPETLRIKTIFKGEVVQDSPTSDMVFGVFELLSFVSSVMTLFPGDVIATGTPSGIGKMHYGDEVEIFIEGIGSLKNRVIKK
ncbi:MAG: fumarylacetoacetate hydrolase family protein [Deltaproteobacteria bacterium]|nr:fumarylacetoacetate hydrolase family protein [Deltaproteobacteria bacterium]